MRLAGADAALRTVLEHVPRSVVEATPRTGTTNPLEAIGAAALRSRDAAGRIAALVRDTAARPGAVRPPRHQVGPRPPADGAGRRAAVPIVVFISLLIGVVLALNGAQQLRQFGAAIFIANLVGISMTREMGPLITAIIVAGRTGSAIAAEIGTMVISEEIDAHAHDGARPGALPRRAEDGRARADDAAPHRDEQRRRASSAATRSASLDLGSSAYLSQTRAVALRLGRADGAGEERRLRRPDRRSSAPTAASRCAAGPKAVGRATTSAVVTAIILCIVANACFTAFFYYTG